MRQLAPGSSIPLIVEVTHAHAANKVELMLTDTSLFECDPGRGDVLARKMLVEACDRDLAGVYSATGHSTQNISITHQQRRCTNLVWALRRCGKLPEGSTVCVIGGSFSGMMLSSLVAMSGLTVHLFEREDHLLQKFYRNSTRYISPSYNTRWLPPRYSLGESAPHFAPPIFAWRHGMASQVAHQWLAEFDLYCQNLPNLHVHRGVGVTNLVRATGAKTAIRTSRDDDLKLAGFDIVLVATGFGNEASPYEDVSDFSYWSSGFDLHYQPRKRSTGAPERILISGNGDSGLTELMHYTFVNFSHDAIENVYAHGIESVIQSELDRSTHTRLTQNYRIHPNPGPLPNDSPYAAEAISELIWFFDQYDSRARAQVNPRATLPLSKSADLSRRIYDEIRRMLANHLDIRQGADSIDFAPFAGRLGNTFQLLLRYRLRRLVAELGSYERAELMERIKPDDWLPAGWMGELARQTTPFQIIVNGLSPTIYSPSLAPANLWFTRLCTVSKSIEYWRGRITDISLCESGYRVRLADGDVKHFDRVATRYGPIGPKPRLSRAAPQGEALRTGTALRLLRGDFLLDEPELDCIDADGSLRRLDLAAIDARRYSAPYRRLQHEIRTLRCSLRPHDQPC